MKGWIEKRWWINYIYTIVYGVTSEQNSYFSQVVNNCSTMNENLYKLTCITLFIKQVFPKFPKPQMPGTLPPLMLFIEAWREGLSETFGTLFDLKH